MHLAESQFVSEFESEALACRKGERKYNCFTRGGSISTGFVPGRIRRLLMGTRISTSPTESVYRSAPIARSGPRSLLGH